jgi:hypothetical protein
MNEHLNEENKENMMAINNHYGTESPHSVLPFAVHE